MAQSPDMSMDIDEMDIDETVPNATIIENKRLSDSLSQSLSFNKLDEPTEVASKHDEIVISDDDDEPVKPPNGTLGDSVVIDLVTSKAASANSKCINYACISGIDMMVAPTFCLTFYRVKSSDNKKREVCQACLNIALLHYDELSLALAKKEVLLNVEIPIRNDLVEIDDSDSEDDEADKEIVCFEDDVIDFIEGNIDKVLEETILSFDIVNQCNISMDYLNAKGKGLENQYREVDMLLQNVRKELDIIYNNTYNPFKFRYEPLQSIDIPDIHTSQINDGVSLSTTETISINDTRSLRKTKPVSYAELEDANAKLSGPIVVSESVKEASQEMIELPHDLPPKGKLERPPLKIGEFYYAVRSHTMGSWIKMRLTSFIKPGQVVNGTATTETMYCVSMENKQHLKYPTSRILSGKEIAYAFPSMVQLEVGTRVIAIFKETGDGNLKKRKDSFYPGVVAEPLLSTNYFRYLIFFDDGYAQYVNYKQVHLIFESSKNVWDDMHVDSRPFIKKYLQSYPERPMVILRKNQKVRTEYNGRWLLATVINIDCSLVQMHFEVSNRFEWIYRGSTRLNPMFKEEQAAANRLRSRGIRKPNESGPYVQYTRNDQEPTEVRAVARKSTSLMGHRSNNGSVPFLPVANEKHIAPTPPPPSRIVFFTPRTEMNIKVVYKSHICSPKCKSFITYDVKKLKGYNPLSKPLLCGWNRVTYKHRAKREINYKAPCGRFIRSLSELHKYLRMTESEMTVDLFDFDFWVQCLAEFVLEQNSTIYKDMSDGIENVAIPIVNYVDNDPNPFTCYSNKRVPMEGVHLNVDPEFLCGCDCEDDCVDKEKCQCWQLTLTGLSYLGKTSPDNVGYTYRRLPEPVITGIYECNSRCKCASTCLNRVAQNPLQFKLQVFKTNNRGWGIRCLNDIPQGAFICIYAGSMLTEQMANEGGKNYGDEYLAELDYIEVVEKMKEDFEEEAVVSEEDEKLSNKSQVDSADEDDGEEYSYKKKGLNEEDSDFVPYMFLPKEKESDTYKFRLRKRTVEDNEKHEKDKRMGSEKDERKSYHIDDDDTVMISDDEDTIHEPSSFNPKTDANLEDSRAPMYTSVREMYGRDECVYVMDAKVSGNIGRFLNHSCSPNVFVQNVFVDTHDLRFPWVAFFALAYIKSGTELTWNYNYDVGSVPGKVLYCHCSSSECRGRLL